MLETATISVKKERKKKVSCQRRKEHRVITNLFYLQHLNGDFYQTGSVIKKNQVYI